MKNPLFFLSVLIAAIIVFGCKKEDADVKACFSYTVTETVAGEVQFINCSENATSYLWDFGDGNTSSEKEPKHTFEGAFPFSVSLVAINGSNQATAINQVTNNIMVYKPNIYIYPLTSINLSVKIEFPQGGNITESIPAYNDG